MLVLTRRIGESITIADNITVTLLGISATQVRIGITAPEEIPVCRSEIQRDQHRPRRRETPSRLTGR